MNQEELQQMQEQEELTAEQQAVLLGQILKALTECLEKNNRKPDRIKIHPKLYDQLFPAHVRFDPKWRPMCFTLPMEPEPGVTYGTFVLESTEHGIIRGH